MDGEFSSFKEEYKALLTAEETAAILRCSRKHIYDILAENPQLKVCISERGVRVKRDRLLEWIEKGGVSTEN